MIRILNKDLRFVSYMRKHTFAQWTEKFRGIGTFQINARLEDENIYLLDKSQQYFVLFDADNFGIIEKIEKSSDSELEKTIVLSGRMAASIFDKRVVYRTLKFSGKTHRFVAAVLDDNLINSSDKKRNMDIDLSYSDLADMDATCSKYVKQVTGGYLFDAIEPALALDKLGVLVRPVVVPQEDDKKPNILRWKVEVIKGTDHTKGNQLGNDVVLFSQSVSNIKQTEYRTNRGSYRNYVYVAGEGEGSDRKWYEKDINQQDSKGETGWNRSELWVDARDIQSEDAEGNVITDSEYESLIDSRIEEKAGEAEAEEVYESTVVQENKLYQFGRDYKLGDFVTILDKELNIMISVQITEVTTSLQGSQRIVDIGLTYGTIQRDIVEQVETNKKVSSDNSVNIKYLENMIQKIQSGGGGTGSSGGEITVQANVRVGTVETLPAGSKATVTNSGSGTEAILNFGIPQGQRGEQGEQGKKGDSVPQVLQPLTFTGAVSAVYDGTKALNVEIPEGGNGGYPLGSVRNLAAKGQNKAIALTWEDPENVTFNGSAIADWAGTKIVRKDSGFPTSEIDGVLIADEKVKDSFSSNALVDKGLEDKKEYYYGLFPYTMDNIYTYDDKDRISGSPSAYSSVLSENSWTLIDEASREGAASKLWKVGDVKDGYTIIGFDHDELADGTGKAGITFVSDVQSSVKFSASTPTYPSAEIYKTTLPGLYAELPGDLRSIVKTVKTEVAMGKTYALKYDSELFLLSYTEIFGGLPNSKHAATEGTKYEGLSTILSGKQSWLRTRYSFSETNANLKICALSLETNGSTVVRVCTYEYPIVYAFSI